MGAVRNVWHEGVWYGPDYPEAGDPPAGAVFEKPVPEDLEDGDFVGLKAVTEPEEAAQFGQPVPVEDTDDKKPETDVESLDGPSQAVTTPEQAAAFRGESADSAEGSTSGASRAKSSRSRAK